MGEKPIQSDSLFSLPVVVGVLVVVGGVAATLISGLFVYRAHRVNAETQRLQAKLQEARESEGRERRARQQELTQETADEAPHLTNVPTPEQAESGLEDESTSEGITVTTLKPGIQLEAQRPAHWDKAEIVDILEDHKVKVRWLSGEPGESIIATELVRGDVN